MNKSGEAPLHYAANAGDLEVAAYLLDHGSDVDCVDSRGWTPVHFAASQGYLCVLQLLLDKVADGSKQYCDKLLKIAKTLALKNLLCHIWKVIV